MESDSSNSHTSEVTVEARSWHSAVTDPVGFAERAVAAALEAAGRNLPATAEVSVLLADDARVRELNRTWRGRDKPTNVLSFPAWDGAPAGPGREAPVHLGDVAVALETVLREAAAEGKPPAHHLAHLVVHGTLHLLGHDHEGGTAEAEAMEALEVAALARLGVPDPYRAAAGEEVSA